MSDTICKARLSEAKPCPYPVHRDGLCILHHPDPNKPFDEFMTRFEDLRSRWAPDGTYMMGIVFPGPEWKRTTILGERLKTLHLTDVTFHGSLVLDSHKAELGSVDLKNVAIGGNLAIRNLTCSSPLMIQARVVKGSIELRDLECQELVSIQAQVGGCFDMKDKVRFAAEARIKGKINSDADFRKAVFEGPAKCEKLEVGGRLDLGGVTFSKYASFRGAKFGAIDLAGTVFANGVDFSETNVGENSENVLLKRNIGQDVYLSEANLSKFLIAVEDASELAKVRMARAEWSTRSPFLRPVLGPKFHYFADINLDDQIRQMGIYRSHFLEDHRMREAGHFYIREMELQRRLEKPYSPHCWVSWLYSKVSRYGESTLRPLVGLVALLLITSGFLFFDGLNQRNPNIQVESRAVFTLNPLEGTFVLLDSGYWEMVMLNFNLLAPHRHKPTELSISEFQLLIVNVETIVAVILISFLVVALRRRFKKRER